MDAEQKNLNWVVLFGIVILSTLLVAHHLVYYEILTLRYNEYSVLFYKCIHTISQGYGLYIIRFSVLALIVTILLFTKYTKKTKITNYALILSPIFAILFIIGYSDNSGVFTFYGKYAYPFIFISVFFLFPLSVAHFTSKDITSNKLGFNKLKKKHSIPIQTEKGTGYILNPFAGIFSEGGPGSGKTVSNIIPCLNEFVKDGFSGVVFDYECDLSEGKTEDGQEPGLITKHVYSFLKKYDTGVKFAFLNLVDLRRTVKVNPISPLYIKSFADALEVSISIMLNLNREWALKRDFWADNAIYAFAGTIWHFVNSKPEFATLPHVVEFLLRDFKVSMNILSLDKEVAPYISPVISPFQNTGSGGQAAGVESSTQFSVAKLRMRESYYVLSPKPDEEFSLDITNPKNPVMFCIGNAPVKSAVYTPVLSSVMQICKTQMNRLGKHRSVFVVDELPSIFIDKLEKLPAEARKKGVVTFLAVQTYTQLQEAYGDKKAKIIFDTCSNYFVGRTTLQSAETISKMFGDYKKEDHSQSYSDSGTSHSVREQYEKLIRVEDITSQAPGHFTGMITGGSPTFFSEQLKLIKYETEDIPQFNPELMNKSDIEINKIVEDNFQRIIKEVDSYISEMVKKFEK